MSVPSSHVYQGTPGNPGFSLPPASHHHGHSSHGHSSHGHASHGHASHGHASHAHASHSSHATHSGAAPMQIDRPERSPGASLSGSASMSAGLSGSASLSASAAAATHMGTGAGSGLSGSGSSGLGLSAGVQAGAHVSHGHASHAAAHAPASSPPAGVGAPAAATSALMQRRLQLEEELKTIERQIFQLEENYIEETAHYGNIIKGWDQFIAARTKPSSSRKPKISTRDRIFSNSSTTAPVLHDPDDMDDYGTRSSTRAAKRHINYADSDEHDEDYEPP